MSNKRWMSMWLAMVLVFTTVFSNGSMTAVQAAEKTEMITVYVAAQGKSTTGAGVTIKKTPVQVEKGTTADVAVKQVLDAAGYPYEMPDSGYGAYLESIHGMGTVDAGNNMWYYWSFYVNGAYSAVGMGSYELQDNDKISLIYSYEDASTQAADFADDISQNPDTAAANQKLLAAQNRQQVLAEAIYKEQFENGSIIPGIEGTANNLYTVFSLIRAGYDKQEFYQAVYEKVEGQLKELEENGDVPTYSATDWATGETTNKEYDAQYYAKIILFVTAMGKDASDIGGFDLIAHMTKRTVYEASSVYNRESTMLLALDAAEYALPQGEDYVTRTELVSSLITDMDNQIASSIQWGVDSVAMAVQPLKVYEKSDNMACNETGSTLNTEDVKKTVKKAVDFLASMQSKDGLYGDSYSANNVWSLSQVMTALGELGINPASEEDGTDFIKNGVTVLDAAGEFVNPETGEVSDSLMSFQPEQLLRGLTDCIMVMQGAETTVYRMGKSQNLPEQSSAATPTATAPAEPTASHTPTTAPEQTAATAPTTVPTAVPQQTAATEPTTEPAQLRLTVQKGRIVIAKGKKAKLLYDVEGVSAGAVSVTASSADKKTAVAKIKGGRLQISVPKKAAAGSHTTVTVKAGTCEVKVQVYVRNQVKAIRSLPKKVSVKKGKTTRLLCKVKTENNKKRTTDEIRLLAVQGTVKLKKCNVKKGKVIFTLQGLQKGVSEVTVKIGNSKARKVKVRVK